MSRQREVQAPRRQLRVISNLSRLNDPTYRTDGELYHRAWRPGGVLSLLKVFIASFRYDYILLNTEPNALLYLAALKLSVPFNRCKLVGLDLLFSSHTTLVGRLKALIKGILLRQCHRILLYYRDTSEIVKHLRLPPLLFDYVPFKINEYEQVTSTPTWDGGYVFCGGKTRRDFDTLAKAVEGQDLAVKVVTTSNEDIAQHGSFLDEGSLPSNVEVVRLDGTARRFIELMAGARVVAIPTKPNITGVGIGVYLMAMALGKPVVITAGPSTEGLLTPELALIVPPEDHYALREAITRACCDEALRSRLIMNARTYALSLGDEGQLIRSIIQWLKSDFSHSTDGKTVGAD